MRKDKRMLTTVLFLLGISLLFGCASQEVKPNETSAGPQAGPKTSSFPSFDLPMPQGEADKAYLGLSGTGSFKIKEIQSQVLLIEIFNFYCPHCQRMAPLMNELYRTIQARSDLKDKIRIIGIGIGNSNYEVDSFKIKYQIPFPLFPNRTSTVTRMLDVTSTPTFFGVKKNAKGSWEQFFREEGEFEDVQKVLDQVIQLSGLKQEESK